MCRLIVAPTSPTACILQCLESAYLRMWPRVSAYATMQDTCSCSWYHCCSRSWPIFPCDSRAQRPYHRRGRFLSDTHSPGNMLHLGRGGLFYRSCICSAMARSSFWIEACSHLFSWQNSLSPLSMDRELGHPATKTSCGSRLSSRESRLTLLMPLQVKH